MDKGIWIAGVAIGSVSFVSKGGGIVFLDFFLFHHFFALYKASAAVRTGFFPFLSYTAATLTHRIINDLCTGDLLFRSTAKAP